MLGECRDIILPRASASLLGEDRMKTARSALLLLITGILSISSFQLITAKVDENWRKEIERTYIIAQIPSNYHFRLP